MKDLLIEIFERNKFSNAEFPDKNLAVNFIEGLFDLLFINETGKYKSLVDFHEKFLQLKTDFKVLSKSKYTNHEAALRSSDELFSNLRDIYFEALLDANAILNFDPAANTLEEVLHSYPGFYAIAVHRISHFLWQRNNRSLSRLFTEHAHSKTGIDIHPGAQIGEAFAIDHGTGIVIGETAIIGNRVKIYQGVTLGSLNVSKENKLTKRHPTIEDDVIIYANATILGGDTIIGRDSIIGGNVWITQSIPSNSVVFHKSELKIKDKTPFNEPINFII
jgi:serine O-acetyltransferase